MRKMKMPEMDVIRFNESDVIVSSGGVVSKTLTVNNLTDANRQNVSITCNGTTVGRDALRVGTGTAVSSLLNDYLGMPGYYKDNDDIRLCVTSTNYTRVPGLSTFDDFGWYPEFEGDYTWDSSTGYWNHQ